MSLIEDEDEPRNIPEFSVSEISGAVKRTIEGEFGHVRVRGEIGRVSRPRSGHVYLDLKDERAVLSGVVWKGQASRLAVQPEEGAEVVATGRLTTFAGQSKYQIVIESLAFAGEGALLAKLERLRKALAAEGLFAEERKRAIPRMPRVIGVVTSPSGAVIRDILHRLAERFPVRVLLWPVAVQGQACAGEVAAAIRGFAALPEHGPVPRPDVLIVARGGGSVEDLWGFNEEAVVRAAAASAIPLISAVGHETDTTLIDFAADRRAPTPSAAAEMAVPVRAELAAQIADLEARRVRAQARRIELARQRLGDLARALPRPERLVEGPRQRLDHASERLLRAPAEALRARRHALRYAAARLPGGLREAVGRARQRLAGPAGRLRPRLLTAPLAQTRERVSGLARRLPRALAAVTREGRRGLAGPAGRLSAGLVMRRVEAARERLGDRAARLRPAAERALERRAERLAATARLLDTLGYRQTLARGYAVVRDGEGEVLTRAAAVRPASALEIEFADGRVDAVGAGEGRGRGRRTPAGGKGGGAAQPSLFEGD
jgi:exodeoxyribonuclease VII large subunit